MLSPARVYPAACAHGGKVYVFGGVTNSSMGNDLADSQAYDPAVKRWEQLTDMPIPCHNPNAIPIGSAIYLVGGNCMPQPDTIDIIQVYNTLTDSWTILEATLPNTCPLAFACGTHIVCLGGEDNDRKAKAKDLRSIHKRVDKFMSNKPHKVQETLVNRGVCIKGITSKPELNYQAGTVVRYLAERDRFEIVLNNGEAAGALKADNLVFAKPSLLRLRGPLLTEWLRAPPDPVPESLLPRNIQAEREACEARGLRHDMFEELPDDLAAKCEKQWGMGNYSRFTWSLDVTTGSWTQLATAPKKHYPGPQGGYFYQDGDVLRDAKDNTLNYDVRRRAQTHGVRVMTYALGSGAERTVS